MVWDGGTAARWRGGVMVWRAGVAWRCGRGVAVACRKVHFSPAQPTMCVTLHDVSADALALAAAATSGKGEAAGSDAGGGGASGAAAAGGKTAKATRGKPQPGGAADAKGGSDSDDPSGVAAALGRARDGLAPQMILCVWDVLAPDAPTCVVVSWCFSIVRRARSAVGLVCGIDASMHRCVDASTRRERRVDSIRRRWVMVSGGGLSSLV